MKGCQSNIQACAIRGIFWDIHDGAHQFSSLYYLTISSPVCAISRAEDTINILDSGIITPIVA